MSDFPCCDPKPYRDSVTEQQLEWAKAELLKRDLVIQNLWARADELVAERNAMTAHINQLADDWQVERDQYDALAARVASARDLCSRHCLGPVGEDVQQP